MVTLRDIAARAGVSVMTVSKAMRDATDIAAATRARIRVLAQEMGYVPDSMAQSLRTRTTRLLGLVISSTTNPIFGRVVMAIQEGAFELGYDLIIGTSLNLVEREEAIIRRFLARRIDGLFISPVYRLAPHAPIYEHLRRRAIPTVLLGPRAPFCADFATIETEDALASYSLTQHLLQLGHKRIALLAGPPVAPWSQARSDGYRRALRDAQLEIDDKLIFTAGTTIEDGERAALQLLNEGTKATAIQAVNDLVAIGAAEVFLKQGFRVPQDISVVGFGNVLISEHFRVPLTTIRQPKFRFGAAAIDVMQKLLKGERPETPRLSSEIVVRSSTGPPPRLRA